MQQCSLGDPGLIQICEGLKGTVALKDLNLSHNNFTTAGAMHLATLLANEACGLRYFNLGNNMIGDEAIRALAKPLAGNETL